MSDIYFKGHRETPAGNTAEPAGEYIEKISASQLSYIQDDELIRHGEEPKTPKQKKKKSKAKKVLCVLLVLLLVSGICGAGAMSVLLADYEPLKLENNGYTDSSLLMSSPGVTNILLMGVDNMDTNAATRSDAMILLSVDTVHGRLKLTSFMRDMYVYVPGYYDTKLTHACAYEGPQLTVDTIEYNFNIKIDGYCKIGYDLLIELVDGLDGITVAEIDSTEARALADEGVYVDPGTNIHLNGRETVQYCRIRHGQSDFQRTERQRETITLIVKKALRTNPVTLVKIFKSLISKVQCTLSKPAIIALAFRAVPCLFKSIEQQQIPADGTWSNATRDSMAVLLVDTDENIKILKDFIY